MISSRSIASPAGGQSQSVADQSEMQVQAARQDQQGPFDGELLDLYVAIMIVVPCACLLRALWS